ncbi:MAG: response regulator, partial [Duncaniella sp.]|nr:response regulator [Duncaniella sp.]
AFEAMEYMAANPVDLIITDISMPDLDGLDMVRSMPEAPMVVFTTAHPDYAVESYRVSAVDYLLKPYSMADFQRAANKALRMAESRRPT